MRSRECVEVKYRWFEFGVIPERAKGVVMFDNGSESRPPDAMEVVLISKMQRTNSRLETVEEKVVRVVNFFLRKNTVCVV